MYDERIEGLIKAALADGMLTEKEKQVLFKRAQEQGIDLDEFEMVLDARLVELQKEEKEKAAKSAPKSDKFGDVRKCPTCGALIPALAVSCAECGYEFSGIEASSSAQLLANNIAKIQETAAAKKAEIISSGKYSTKHTATSISPQHEALREIDNDTYHQIKATIENLPIPNAKHDLFDLILFLQNHLGEDMYKKKFNECIQRANYLFPNDSLLKQVVDKAQKANKEHKTDVTSDAIMMTTEMICIGLGLIAMYFRGTSHDWNWLKWIGGFYLYGCLGIFAGMAIGYLIKLLYLKINKTVNKN